MTRKLILILAAALVAACALLPADYNGEEYVDGGLTSPVPVKVARAMGADIVIAVDVSWFAQARA